LKENLQTRDLRHRVQGPSRLCAHCENIVSSSLSHLRTVASSPLTLSGDSCFVLPRKGFIDNRDSDPIKTLTSARTTSFASLQGQRKLTTLTLTTTHDTLLMHRRI
jgi:hypothetical protein